jgi:hypothetical protein
MGRHSTYNQETADRICERIELGHSLVNICSDVDMPDRVTVNRWMHAYPDFATNCARARYRRMDDVVDEMQDIEMDVMHGVLGAAEARVILSSKQWRAERMAPKNYGPRQSVELSGEIKTVETIDLSGLSDDALAELGRALGATPP